jgi:hypothetical protein
MEQPISTTEAKVKEIRLAVGIPCQDTIKMTTMISLITAINTLPPDTMDCVIAHGGSLVHWSRNHIVETAKARGSTHLFFLDTDMKFPETTISRLLAHDKAIVGVLSFKKQFPKTPTIHVMEETGRYRLAKNGEIPGEMFQEIDGKRIAVGTGLMLIDLSKVKMEPPWFKAEYPGPGEDIYFCHVAGLSGAETWCDPTIDVRHIGDYDY